MKCPGSMANKEPTVLTWNDGFHFALDRVDEYLDSVLQSRHEVRQNNELLDLKLFVRELSKIPVQVSKESHE